MARRLATLNATYEALSLQRLLAALSPQKVRYARSWQEAEFVRRASAALVYRLPGPAMGNCLKLAILRYEILRGMGLNVIFHLGVRPSPEGLTGHAWLTLNDEPLWEDHQKLAGFRETFRYPTLEEGRKPGLRFEV